MRRGKDMKYYAIRTGEQVELRSALAKPVAITSKLIRKLSKPIDSDDMYGDKIRVTKVELKQVYYRGGKTVGICGYDKYSYYIGGIPRDGMIEVSPAILQKALSLGYKV